METVIESVRAWFVATPFWLVFMVGAGGGWVVAYLASWPLRRLGRWWRGRRAAKETAEWCEFSRRAMARVMAEDDAAPTSPDSGAGVLQDVMTRVYDPLEGPRWPLLITNHKDWTGNVTLSWGQPSPGPKVPYGSKPDESQKPVRHDAHVALEARVAALEQGRVIQPEAMVPDGYVLQSSDVTWNGPEDAMGRSRIVIQRVSEYVKYEPVARPRAEG